MVGRTINIVACAMVMRRDFEYWGIDELDLEPCCALKFYPNIEICNTQIEGDIQDKMKEEQEKLDEDFGDNKLGRLRSNDLTNGMVEI